MNIDIECPSGLRGEVRNLRVAEANELATAVGKNRLGATAKILNGCWMTMHDPGPYKFDGQIDWGKVLQGDCDYTLIQIRKATYGADYHFGITCSEYECREKFEWTLSLDDLEVRRWDDAARDQFTQGNKYAVAMPGSDAKVTFALPVHKDQKRAAKLRKGHRQELITLALRLRVQSVEGVEPHLLSKHLTDLELPVARELIDLMDEFDCGINTDIDVECPECWTQQEVRLPLGKDFWYPETKTKAARRKREEASSLAG